MKQLPVEITGLMLRNAGSYIYVELEINGKWVEVLREFCGPMETAISVIMEPDGIRNIINGKGEFYKEH